MPERSSPEETEFTSEFAEALGADSTEEESREDEREKLADRFAETLDTDLEDQFRESEANPIVENWETVANTPRITKWARSAKGYAWSVSSGTHAVVAAEALSQKRWAEGALYTAFTLASAGLARRGFNEAGKAERREEYRKHLSGEVS